MTLLLGLTVTPVARADSVAAGPQFDGKGSGTPAVATISIVHDSSTGFRTEYQPPDAGSVPSTWSCTSEDEGGIFSVACYPSGRGAQEYYCYSPYVLVSYFGSPLDSLIGESTCAGMVVWCTPQQNPLVQNYCEEHRAGPATTAPFTCRVSTATALAAVEWSVRCRTYHLLPRTESGRSGDDEHAGYSDGDSGAVSGLGTNLTGARREAMVDSKTVKGLCKFRVDTTVAGNPNDVFLTVTGTGFTGYDTTGATTLQARPVAVELRCVVLDSEGTVVFDMTRAESGAAVPLAGQNVIYNRAPYTVCVQGDAKYENGEDIVLEYQCMEP